MKIDKFEELDVWKLSRELVKEIYSAAKTLSFSKDFGLTNQITRASVSVMSNIAEGFERKSNTEFMQYLFIAKGSAAEVRSQLYVSYDLNYINKEQFDLLISKAEIISKSLSGFIKYMKSLKK